MNPSPEIPTEPKWTASPPRLYDVVTGFFPETSPKQTWATNPRPLLICGVARHKGHGLYFCRVAYGTTKHLNKAHPDDLVVGNLSSLNDLELMQPTRFVINSGAQMVILPWSAEFFRPWSGHDSPVLSRLPEDMQRYVGGVLMGLSDLPAF